jgi:hypothetical protein
MCDTAAVVGRHDAHHVSVLGLGSGSKRAKNPSRRGAEAQETRKDG